MGNFYLLKSCRDGDDFLDSTTQPLDVITPIKDLNRPTKDILMSVGAHTQIHTENTRLCLSA